MPLRDLSLELRKHLVRERLLHVQQLAELLEEELANVHRQRSYPVACTENAATSSRTSSTASRSAASAIGDNSSDGCVAACTASGSRGCASSSRRSTVPGTRPRAFAPTRTNKSGRSSSSRCATATAPY